MEVMTRKEYEADLGETKTATAIVKMARQDFEYRHYNPAKWPDYLAGWQAGYHPDSPVKTSCGPQDYEQGFSDGLAVQEGRDAHPDRALLHCFGGCGKEFPREKMTKSMGQRYYCPSCFEEAQERMLREDPGYEIVTSPGERPEETAVRVLQEMNSNRARLGRQHANLMRYCTQNKVHLRLNTRKCGDCDHQIDTIVLVDNESGESTYLLNAGDERFPES